jgi:hypothetical protein
MDDEKAKDFWDWPTLESVSEVDANLMITWSRNPQSRLRSDPGKPK